MKKYSVVAAALLMSLCAQPVRRPGISPQMKVTKTPEAAASAVRACMDLRKHGKLPEARTCFTGLLRSPSGYARAEGLWGIEDYKGANEEFKVLIKAEPANPESVSYTHLTLPTNREV